MPCAAKWLSSGWWCHKDRRKRRGLTGRRYSGFRRAATRPWDIVRRLAALPPAAGDLPEPAGDALGPLRDGNKEWATRLEGLLREAEHQTTGSGRNAIFPED